MEEFLQDNWKQLREPIKHRWSKLSDADLKEINGDYNNLVALLQLYYGYSMERAANDIGELVQQYQNEPAPLKS